MPWKDRENVVDDSVSQIMGRIFTGMTGAPEEEQRQEMFKKRMAG